MQVFGPFQSRPNQEDEMFYRRTDVGIVSVGQITLGQLT